MIYRIKDYNSPPSSLVDSKWEGLKNNLLSQKDGHKADTRCYRDTTLKQLVKLYEHKCSVCGRGRGYELQVDHYRPRKPRNHKANTEYNHTGYYWLTYTWSNLIPLCSKCNSHKSNKFPIKTNNRIGNPNPLLAHHYDIHWLNAQEMPYLINPELETEPARHFSFKPNGEIVGRTPEGKETIRVYKLNRKDLKRERVEVRASFTNQIVEVMNEYVKNENSDELKGGLKTIFRNLLTGCGPKADFSLFHVYMFKYFNEFITNKLPNSIRTVIKNYFNEFKATNHLPN